MADGYRSFAAFWAGGASSVAPTAVGFRSFAAFWAGGASSIAPSTDAGYRSFGAFWMGGAGSYTAPVPPTVLGPQGGGGGTTGRRRHRESIYEKIWEKERLLAVANAALLDVSQSKQRLSALRRETLRLREELKRLYARLERIKLIEKEEEPFAMFFLLQ